MNHKPKPTPQTELDRLYSESGDAEPAAGLDRIVLARAEQALGNSRRARRRPVLAGLATASVALVALAAVLRQIPPAAEPAGPFEPSDVGSVSEEIAAPDMKLSEADAAGEPPREARRELEAPAARNRGGSFEARQTVPEPAAPAAADAVDPPETSAVEPSLRSVTVTGSRILADTQAIDDEPRSTHERLFEQLRALIADGKPDQARQLLRQARATDGRIVLPEDLADSLGEPNESD